MCLLQRPCVMNSADTPSRSAHIFISSVITPLRAACNCVIKNSRKFNFLKKIWGIPLLFKNMPPKKQMEALFPPLVLPGQVQRVFSQPGSAPLHAEYELAWYFSFFIKSRANCNYKELTIAKPQKVMYDSQQFHQEKEIEMLNKVLLIGRLGADPEVRLHPWRHDGCHFNIATSEYRKDKNGERIQKTNAQTVTFGKLAEICTVTFQREIGFIEGRIQSRILGR